jgi:hypothetical protein
MYPLIGREAMKIFLFCGFAIDSKPGPTVCRSNVGEKGDDAMPIGLVPEEDLAVGSSWPPVSKGPETGPVSRGTRWAADSQERSFVGHAANDG